MARKMAEKNAKQVPRKESACNAKLPSNRPVINSKINWGFAINPTPVNEKHKQSTWSHENDSPNKK